MSDISIDAETIVIDLHHLTSEIGCKQSIFLSRYNYSELKEKAIRAKSLGQNTNSGTIRAGIA
jgi:hypothetical protein